MHSGRLLAGLDCGSLAKESPNPSGSPSFLFLAVALSGCVDDMCFSARAHTRTWLFFVACLCWVLFCLFVLLCFVCVLFLT